MGRRFQKIQHHYLRAGSARPGVLAAVLSRVGCNGLAVWQTGKGISDASGCLPGQDPKPLPQVKMGRVRVFHRRWDEGI